MGDDDDGPNRSGALADDDLAEQPLKETKRKWVDPDMSLPRCFVRSWL